MIHQHTCPICGTAMDAAEQIAALRARLEALEGANSIKPTETRGMSKTHAAPLQRARSIKAGGVRITPRWDWTTEYEAHVRGWMRDQAKPRDTPTEQLIARAAAYARWIAKRDGRKDVPARCVWIEIDDSDVVFCERKVDERQRHRYGIGRHVYIRGEEIARVTIPNMHWTDPCAAANDDHLIAAE